jgi:hypothetical protein
VSDQAVSGLLPLIVDVSFESFCRKTDYELTEVTIRVLGSEDPDPTPETYTRDSGPIMVDNRQTSILTYRSRNAEPQRQSKRIRTVKRKEQRIGISKQMSVKDIKLLVCHYNFTAFIGPLLFKWPLHFS